MDKRQEDQEQHLLVQAYLEKRNLAKHTTMLYETGQMVLSFEICEHAAYAENKNKHFCMLDASRECLYGLACKKPVEKMGAAADQPPGTSSTRL